MLPKDLEAHVGGERVRNYWGGFSRSAKMAMESLHSRGELRIAHREKGMRVYARAEAFEQTLSREERFKEIIVVALQAMGATTPQFLMRELGYFGNLVGSRDARRKCLQDVIDAGPVRVDRVDSVEYISLAATNGGRRSLDDVHILAPFDPIVRDRARFEHLWNWAYRFEAYTPKAKRRMGYYAMPVLWQEWIVGWANAAVENDRLNVQFGYPEQRPAEREYRDAAEMEVARLAAFLGLAEGCWDASI